jgi:hypothetical protein
LRTVAEETCSPNLRAKSSDGTGTDVSTYSWITSFSISRRRSLISILDSMSASRLPSEQHEAIPIKNVLALKQ